MYCLSRYLIKQQNVLKKIKKMKWYSKKNVELGTTCSTTFATLPAVNIKNLIKTAFNIYKILIRNSPFLI